MLSNISDGDKMELSYEMDSKNMRHTFETFFFSNPAKGHCVQYSKKDKGNKLRDCESKVCKDRRLSFVKFGEKLRNCVSELNINHTNNDQSYSWFKTYNCITINNPSGNTKITFWISFHPF